MLVESEDLERLILFHGHVAAELGTDHPRFRSADIALTLVQKGFTTKEAFDAANGFLRGLKNSKAKKSKPQS